MQEPLRGNIALLFNILIVLSYNVNSYNVDVIITSQLDEASEPFSCAMALLFFGALFTEKCVAVKPSSSYFLMKFKMLPHIFWRSLILLNVLKKSNLVELSEDILLNLVTSCLLKKSNIVEISGLILVNFLKANIVEPCYFLPLKKSNIVEQYYIMSFDDV